MAALSEPLPRTPDCVHDLREFRSSDLEPILQAEQREWLNTLRWDFAKSADLVRKFLDLGSLNGAALVNAAGVFGYAYFVFEDGKGLVGDIYVLPQFRSSYYEGLLMTWVLDQIGRIGGIPRVEAQLMTLSAPLEKPLQYWSRYEVFRRSFLIAEAAALNHAPYETLPEFLAIEPWRSSYQEFGAHLIPATYCGHIDSRINDQYRSVTGARKFLHNMLQFPGCGIFHDSASFAVFDRRDGRMCAMILSSIVSGDTGHITQLCVHPEFQGLGVGRELLQRAAALLGKDGCRNVSLTVTVENRYARMLYERAGFQVARKFTAYVWEP